MAKAFNYNQAISNIMDFCIKSNNKFIYISGNGGSGKSTLARELKNRFEDSGFSVNLVDTDNFITNTTIRKNAKATFFDSLGNEYVDSFTSSFEESYFMPSLNGIIYNLRAGLDQYFIPKHAKNENDYILLNSKSDFTIVEGIATTFLEKYRNALLIFIHCDVKLEVDRRLERARNGETEQEIDKLIASCKTRRKQLNSETITNMHKFDLVLESIDAFDFIVEKDVHNILGDKMNKDCDFLLKTIKHASNLLVPNFEIMDKDSQGDIVTSLDLNIEKFIIDKVEKEYPNFDIISEELNPKDKLTSNCFIINAIDGTVNLSKKMPIFGMQIAIVRNNKTTASVIYLPILNELYYADENFAYLNGERIVTKPSSLKKGLFAATGTERIETIVRLKDHGKLLRDFGSIAVAFAWVASGKLNGAIYKGNKLWNYYPVLHLCEKAGAKIINKNNLHIAASDDAFLELLK